MYTQICGELASRGFVVASVEHRDGTGPSAMVIDEDGKERPVEFLRWDKIESVLFLSLLLLWRYDRQALLFTYTNTDGLISHQTSSLRMIPPYATSS